MNLRNELKLNDCKIVELTKYPKSPEPSRVLVITLPLKPTVAQALKCHDMCYDINENQRKFEGAFGFDYDLADVEIRLQNSKAAIVPLSPKAIKKFRIGHDAKDNLTLTFRCHFVGYGDALEEWSDDINDKAFDCSILSLQGELFPEMTADPKGDGPAGGKKVDMSGKKEEAGEPTGSKEADDVLEEFGPDDGPCISCNNRIPYEDPDKTTHANGMRCSRSAGATLASASTSGGTHQKGTRGRRKMDLENQVDTEDDKQPVN